MDSYSIGLCISAYPLSIMSLKSCHVATNDKIPFFALLNNILFIYVYKYMKFILHYTIVLFICIFIILIYIIFIYRLICIMNV